MPTNTTHISRGTARYIPFLLIILAAVGVILTSRPPSVPTTQQWTDIDTDEGLAPRPKWELVPAVQATFLRESYKPGATARLVLWHREGPLTIQFFHAGPGYQSNRSNTIMTGVAVSRPAQIGPRSAHQPFLVRIGAWPSGVYFARLAARDGRIGYAPFIVRPKQLGEHRVLVVMPTYTWQAYNFRDDNGDGYGDTWYAGWRQNWAKLARPFLARGVPPHYATYDLRFLHWLAWNHKQVDFFADSDLGASPSAQALAKRYDLIVFPGHHEYVTTREYNLIEGYRNLGGNLAFLSADNLFWRIDLHGNVMTRVKKWRDLGRPEASIVGVQYIGTDLGRHQGPWVLRHVEKAPWLFDRTGLQDGSDLAHGGIEIDHTQASSPHGIQVLAEMPELFGPGFTAQMTYYDTARGAKVFAAGAFTLAGCSLQPQVSQLLENLWERLSQP
jgi:N,N-dimethylformamidase beta subunit-like, C-terminal